MCKICPTCKESKELEVDFYTNKSSLTGYSSQCKECDKRRARLSYSKDPKKNNEKCRRYQKEHSETVKTNLKRWKKNNASHCKEYNSVYFKEYQKTDKYKEYKAKWASDRMRTDFNAKLIRNARNRTYKALKGKLKPSSVTKSFGCSDLAAYIRTTYLPGMTDSNYGNGPGQWSVDHIVPISSFDLTDETQLNAANHYTNLRALWHIDNLKKWKTTEPLFATDQAPW